MVTADQAHQIVFASHVFVAGTTPVIPTFKAANSCIQSTSALFCWSWVSSHWGNTLLPELLQHIKLSVLGVVFGSAFAIAAATVAHRYRFVTRPFLFISTVLYTVPTIAFLELIAPVTGLGTLTVLLALTSYTLIVVFRNTLTGFQGVPDDVLEAAYSAGMTRRQALLGVTFPLATPAIIAGIRIATVVTIAVATLAAYISPVGLGVSIFEGIRNSFNTELIASGGLAIILAIAADGLLVGVQRLATPWARGRTG